MGEKSAPIRFSEVPENFPHKGKFVEYDRSWSRTGNYTDTPNYIGQQPIRFPEWWGPAHCFSGWGPEEEKIQ